MRRRTLASLLSALLIAAGLTALSAAPSSAAANDCNLNTVNVEAVIHYSASDTSETNPMTFSPGTPQTVGGVKFYELTSTQSADTYEIDVQCFIDPTTGANYTNFSIYALNPIQLVVGSKFTVTLTGILTPLVAAASVSEQGSSGGFNGALEPTSTNIWGKVVDAKGAPTFTGPTWQVSIASDSWASGADWLGQSCGAALAAAAADVTKVPAPTIFEADNANVTILKAQGKLQVAVSGDAGATADVSVVVPDFYLTSPACGWNLILEGKSNAEVKAQVEAFYGASEANLTVTSDSQAKTHKFSVSSLALRSLNLRSELTPLVIEPRSESGGGSNTNGGGSNTNGGGSTPAAKKAQSATSTPVIPASVKWKKKMVLLKSAVTTDAGQKATAVVTCAKSMKCKAKTSASGAVTVTTKKKTGKITLTLSAPATATYDAYSLVKVIKLKK